MIKFEYENWSVTTTSADSPLYKVVDTDYNETMSLAVKKSYIEEIMDVAKQGFEPEQLAILIASVNFNRTKCDKHNPCHKTMKQEIIVSGLKSIFSTTNSYDVDTLLVIFNELRPNEVEKILTSTTPVVIIRELTY